MSVKKSGLGRGFESLIPTDVLDETFDPTAMRDEQVSELRYIRRQLITPNADQPRRTFDDEALQELAASIRQHGILQPLVVTPKDGLYEIVAGERRWRAAEIAEVEKLPVIIRTLSDQHKLELALIENLQRADLNPLEIATAYLKLHTQFNMTYEEIGDHVGGKAVSTISNSLRMLQLPEDAKQALVTKQISEGHARQILALTGDADAQADLLSRIVAEGWSVRKAEQYVVGYRKGETKPQKTEQAVSHTRTQTQFTEWFSHRIKLPVSNKTTAHGGQIIIQYASEDELAELQKLLGQ